MVVQTSIRSFFAPTETREVGAAAPKAAVAQVGNRKRTESAVTKAKSAYEQIRSATRLDLGAGSEILFYPRFLDPVEADGWLKQLDRDMPWSRPSLLIHGQLRPQPRQSVYVADRNLPTVRYNGHEPSVCFWEDYPVLCRILDEVHRALPGTRFNSVLLNRYADGADHVSWHSDDTKVFGPTPLIASVTLGAERDFLVRRKKHYRPQAEEGAAGEAEAPECCDCSCEGTVAGGCSHARDDLGFVEAKRRRLNSGGKACSSPPKQEIKDQYSFLLKHGSLLVMKGNMQRDWQHSVPKRAKVCGVRINLTFRIVLSDQPGRYLGPERS